MLGLMQPGNNREFIGNLIGNLIRILIRMFRQFLENQKYANNIRNIENNMRNMTIIWDICK